MFKEIYKKYFPHSLCTQDIEGKSIYVSCFLLTERTSKDVFNIGFRLYDNKELEALSNGYFIEPEIINNYYKDVYRVVPFHKAHSKPIEAFENFCKKLKTMFDNDFRNGLINDTTAIEYKKLGNENATLQSQQILYNNKNL